MGQAKTRTNQKYLKMTRKQLELSEAGTCRRHKLGASVTRFAVSPQESDEEKAIANGKRSSKTWFDETREQRKAINF
jgi:hypothetical protein